MAANLFGTSRRQLSIIYSGVMIAFLAVLIIGVHETVESSTRQKMLKNRSPISISIPAL